MAQENVVVAPKKVKKLLKYQKIGKNAGIHYGAFSVMKEMGLSDK